MNSAYHPGHPFIIQSIRTIRGPVIVPVPEKRRVSDHDGRILLLPVQPVIRENLLYRSIPPENQETLKISGQ